MARAVRSFPWARVLLAIFIAAAIAVTVIASRGTQVPGWIAMVLLLGIFGTVTLGIFFAQLGLFARPIVAAERDDALLALTFDDGPEPEITRQILDLLDARGHRATFFVIGHRAERERDLLAEIARRGHLIANHSFAHRHTTPFLPPARLAAELADAEALLASARPEGAPRGRWFRPPIGIISPRVARAAKLAGLELVSWTASARDGTRRATVDSALARLRPHLRPGAILVLHDGAEKGDRRPIAADVLEKLLLDLDEKGLRSVTLDELLA